jgi:hypothetical protein
VLKKNSKTGHANLPEPSVKKCGLTVGQVKARKIVDLALSGERYEDIAEKVGSPAKPENRRQAVYSRLQGQVVQAVLREKEEEIDYSIDQCLKDLDKAYQVAERRDQSLAMTQAAMAKAKVKGLLVDKVQDVTVPDIDDTARKAREMLDHLDELEREQRQDLESRDKQS